jgi:hypothetical protein
MMMFEKDMHKSDFSLIGLSNQNEISKKISFEKVKFEIIVRIKQAFSKKETEENETQKMIADNIRNQRRRLN